MDQDLMRRDALRYIKRGWRVFPVHELTAIIAAASVLNVPAPASIPSPDTARCRRMLEALGAQDEADAL